MASHWFNPPVYVKTDRPGLRFGVSHVEGASEQLLKWTKKGPKWAYAVSVCRAALAEEVPPQQARKAFEAAAKEEEMFLPPV
ncbi:DUF982 domain-containing protein [Mesorhizobium qingshengii]|uniref:DUF982 domain-containing protein n=1 Tax=Mesorhizobium qingshengii TaxID=1165689 RepID=A0ABT4R4E2_9HYPH|nr:DUF982 domain-containing protein [Mesorhizobium qingshengii]MCZ8548708.1 DUF982 domain-containing protein [Mesorhizobium qingshengii]